MQASRLWPAGKTIGDTGKSLTYQRKSTARNYQGGATAQRHNSGQAVAARSTAPTSLCPFQGVLRISHTSKGFRFLENHDDPRAAATFAAEKARAAAVTVLALPGANLLWRFCGVRAC